MFGAEKRFPPSSAPYVTVFDASPLTDTTPFRTSRSEVLAPSCLAASPRSTARASAAACRTCGPPFEIAFEPAVMPWFGEYSVSTTASLTWAIDRSSSSAAICRSPVFEPVMLIFPK